MPLLTCSGISLELGGRTILESVSLDVEPAEVVGLAGPNGAGKTSFQRPIVPAALTVGETLKAARRAYPPQPSRLKVEWAVDFVRLRAHMEQPTGSLETLERRKLMLACLLLHEPRIVLLDEPASGLTGSEIDEIDLVVRKLSQEHGVAVLLIEHRLELLAMVAKRVLVLDVGRIIAEGPPETVFLDETVRQAYFDVPIDAERYGDLNLDLEDA